MRLTLKMTLPIVLTAVAAFAQSPQDPQPNGPQPDAGTDVLGRLHLTADQLQKIRLIQRQTRDERIAIGDRLREANRALEDALDAENIDEVLIEQRAQAVSVAQSAQLRMRIQIEMRIRRLLNAEQLAIWRELRLKAGDILKGNQRDRRPPGPGVDGRNGLAPTYPRRGDGVRPPRP